MTVTIRHTCHDSIDIALLEGIATGQALQQVCRCVADGSAFGDCGGLVIDVSRVPIEGASDDPVPVLAELEQTAHTLAAQHRWFAVVDRQHREASSATGLVYDDAAAAVRSIHRMVALVAGRTSRHPRLRTATDLGKLIAYPVARATVRATTDVATLPLRLGRAAVRR